jgi:tyrosinase
MHNALGGIMAYLQAPADPIFYSHHGLVDLLQTIYLKCQTGDENLILSAAAKSSDSRWYSTCARKTSGVVYTKDDNITMRVTGYDGRTFVNVWQNPQNVLYPFFKDLPYKYVDYIDAKDLGNYSYTYAISGGLANMYQNCWASNKITSAATLLAQESAHREYTDHLEPIIEPGTTNDDKVKRWNIALFEAARIVGYEEEAAREQMEMVTCQYQEDCLGGVDDFTDLYRTNFGIEGHTRCYTIIESLKDGDSVIGIPQWKDISNRFLPCAAYSKTKNSLVSSFAKAVADFAKNPSDYATSS